MNDLPLILPFERAKIIEDLIKENCYNTIKEYLELMKELEMISKTLVKPAA